MSSALIEASSPFLGTTSHSEYENATLRHSLQEVRLIEDNILDNGTAGTLPGWNVHRILGFCYITLIQTWVPITVYFSPTNFGQRLFCINLGVGMLRECVIEEAEEEKHDDPDIAWEFSEDSDSLGLMGKKKREERTFDVWNSMPIFKLNLRRKKFIKRWKPFMNNAVHLNEMPYSHFFLNESLMHAKIIADIDNDPHFEFLRIIEPATSIQSPIKEYKLHEDKFIRQRYYYTPSRGQREEVRFKSKREIG
jgi:hypothetical protein